MGLIINRKSPFKIEDIKYASIADMHISNFSIYKIDSHHSRRRLTSSITDKYSQHTVNLLIDHHMFYIWQCTINSIPVVGFEGIDDGFPRVYLLIPIYKYTKIPESPVLYRIYHIINLFDYFERDIKGSLTNYLIIMIPIIERINQTIKDMT